MFQKNLKMTYLLDFYGDVLDEHTREVMEAYYDDDLSLAEIATDEGISRQGIRHIIKRGEEQLVFLEDKLGLAEHYKKLDSYKEKLLILEKKLSDAGDEDGRNLISEVIEQINSKGF